jgi:hypothetical protein
LNFDTQQPHVAESAGEYQAVPMFFDASATSQPPIIAEIVGDDEELRYRRVANVYSLSSRNVRVLFVTSPVFEREETIKGIWIQPRADFCHFVSGHAIKQGTSRAGNTAVRTIIRVGQMEESAKEIGW